MCKLFSIVFLLVLPICNSFINHNYNNNVRNKISSILQTTDEKAAISLDRLGSAWKVIQYGQNGLQGLECIDQQLAEEAFSVQMSKKGGLGLDLIELYTDKSNSGLVVINEILPGSNADKTGKFKIGDTLLSIAAVTPSDSSLQPASLEGLNFDSTIDEISKFAEFDDIVLTGRRLVQRKKITVKLFGPTGIVQIYVLYDRVYTLYSLNSILHNTLVFIAYRYCLCIGEYFTNFTVMTGNPVPLRNILLNKGHNYDPLPTLFTIDFTNFSVLSFDVFGVDIKLYDSRTGRFDSPYQTGDCGGEGTCGTCMVAVLQGRCICLYNFTYLVVFGYACNWCVVHI